MSRVRSIFLSFLSELPNAALLTCPQWGQSKVASSLRMEYADSSGEQTNKAAGAIRASWASTSKVLRQPEHVLSRHTPTLRLFTAITGEDMIGVRCPHSAFWQGPCLLQNV